MPGTVITLTVITWLVAILALGFTGAPFWSWALVLGTGLAYLTSPAWFLVVAVAWFVFYWKPLRQALLTRPLFRFIQKKKLLPKISGTEREALNAGDVWVERELFSGKPDFGRLQKEPYRLTLTQEEKDFLDGPVETLCAKVQDWDVWRDRDLPEEVWDFLKRERFFGMIIPKQYGGLGFSATAHSEVVLKLSSRSLPLGITVMVPNSLGPAELLIQYGTDAQKNLFLPRLARGEEIPAFALTEPHAGSDAASIRSSGVVFRGAGGKLFIRLEWNKRWITLASVCTVLGLAFRLRDPENLLGRGEDLGITCALVPIRTPGVIVGRRHDPLGVPFVNSPTQGKGVVVPIEAIIGGAERAGQGWHMLMEALAAGRGISLPAQATGSSKISLRVTGAHAAVRHQFGMPIGRLQALAEPLARMTGFLYVMDASRRFTVSAIDEGVRPPIVTAILKQNLTELSRRITNDAMDVLGGQGISLGPNNLVGHTYLATPISITVEGANILTRTLMIFGQGALRAHPYALQEVVAAEISNVDLFDRAFWNHLKHIVQNAFRALLLSLTRGYLAGAPRNSGAAAGYYRKLGWASASFAFWAEVAMAARGAKLKAEGRISGRFADILSWMFLCASALRRFEAEGRRQEDWPVVDWVLRHGLNRIQVAFDELYANLRVPGLSWVLKGPVRAWAALNPLARAPSDALEQELATLIQKPGEQRERLLGGAYVPGSGSGERLAELETALMASGDAEKATTKVQVAVRRRLLAKAPPRELHLRALEQGIITAAEFEALDRAARLRDRVIQVDDFSPAEYHPRADLEREEPRRRVS